MVSKTIKELIKIAEKKEMTIPDIYKELVEIRFQLSIDLPKGKQRLTLFIQKLLKEIYQNKHN